MSCSLPLIPFFSNSEIHVKVRLFVAPSVTTSCALDPLDALGLTLVSLPPLPPSKPPFFHFTSSHCLWTRIPPPLPLSTYASAKKLLSSPFFSSVTFLPKGVRFPPPIPFFPCQEAQLKVSPPLFPVLGMPFCSQGLPTARIFPGNHEVSTFG